jgi:hypothetical protein
LGPAADPGLFENTIWEGMVMSALLWILAVIAIVLFIIGGTVKAVGFLLWIAPIVLVVAVIMFFVNRGRSV